jgi:Family of unknown function (DUF5685)
MFGLLQKRNCTCDTTDAVAQTAKNDYRLHYCGTCKTIGANYGQAARMFLNFDTVFLSELLSSLDEEASQTWNAAYQSRSCFALPQQKAVQPFALQYAAAVNVFMTELKLNDRIADQKIPFVAVAIRRLLNRNFQKAATDLQRFGVDIAAIYALEKTQIKVERAIFAPETTPEAMLAHFATPTAEMTALIFGTKTLISSKKESNNTDENEIAKMQAFGHAFGTLVYILDALEDFDKDHENKEFNALRAAFATENLGIKDRLFVTNYLRKAEQTMTLALNDLPLSETAKADFAARISANLTLRLHQAARPYLSLKQSLSERIVTEWNYRTATAKTLANQAFTNVSQEIFAPFAAAHYASFGAIAFFYHRLHTHFLPKTNKIGRLLRSVWLRGSRLQVRLVL